jgi:hypothetical protein
MRRHRRGGDRRRRQREAGDELDLVAGDQFGGDRLGGGARGRALVALDEFDPVRRDVAGVLLEVEIECLVHLGAEIGIDARIGQDNADPDGLGRGRADAECEAEDAQSCR